MLLLLARPTPWRWSGAAWRDVFLFGIASAGLVMLGVESVTGAAGFDPLGVLRGVAIALIIGATIGMTASAAKLSTEVVEQRRARQKAERTAAEPDG